MNSVVDEAEKIENTYSIQCRNEAIQCVMASCGADAGKRMSAFWMQVLNCLIARRGF